MKDRALKTVRPPAGPAPRLVLASASPRRAHILTCLGLPFRLTVSGADESLRALDRRDRRVVHRRLEEPLAIAKRGHRIVDRPAEFS